MNRPPSGALQSKRGHGLDQRLGGDPMRISSLLIAIVVVSPALAAPDAPLATTKAPQPAALRRATFAPKEKQTDELDRQFSLSELQPTPEMWYYQQQLKMYKDPKLAVRRNAEYRAAQRQVRMAAAKWYGISNSRPMAQHTPFMGGAYGPGFSGGYDDKLWIGVQSPVIIVDHSRDDYRSLR